MAAAVGAIMIVPLYALPVGTATSVAWVMHAATLLVAATSMLRAAATADAAVRRAYRFIGASMAASGAGAVTATAYVAVVGEVPIPSLVDPVTLLWVPLAVAGLLVLPRRPGVRRSSLLLAEGAVAGSALLFVSWVTVMAPLIDSQRFSALGLATQLAYPVCDVAVAAMVLLLVPQVRADVRPLLGLVGPGMLLVALSDSGFVLVLAQHGEPRFAWCNVTLQAGLAMLACAAAVRTRTELRSDGDSSSAERMLPLVVVGAAGVFVMGVVVRTGSLGVADSAFALLMLLCVLVRQALYGRDVALVSEQHRHAAAHDALTGLANRARFLDRLTELVETPRTPPAVVLLMDLDGFKEVNDALGHEAGDHVLVDCGIDVSAAAAGSALVARLGGDEFAVLVTGPDAADQAGALAEALASRPVRSAVAVPTPVHWSIGLTTVLDQDTAGEVLRRADIAMYDAKRSDRRVVAFNSELALRAERRSRLSSDLVAAIAKGELSVVYQPLYRLTDGELTGVEALVRWTHPLFGAVPPDEFIPLAEETGHIHVLGAWVLEQAVAQTVTWERAGGHVAHLFVNVSGLQFTDTLPAAVAEVLRRHGLPAARLTLEITESQMPALAVNRAMATLRAAGVRIALDDFGAGYSSLAQLVRLPVDVLKIDRDFIRNLGEAAGRPVLDAIIGLARALGLSTVAEGIEDLDQAAEASNAGVDLGQGYLFSRPEPAAALARRLPPVPTVAVPQPREPQPDSEALVHTIPKSA